MCISVCIKNFLPFQGDLRINRQIAPPIAVAAHLQKGFLGKFCFDHFCFIRAVAQMDDHLGLRLAEHRLFQCILVPVGVRYY